MIFQNNARTLRVALDSVKDHVDEFVFVDGGSVDNTVEIARSYRNSKVISHPWDGNFARQLNLALDAASGQWVLRLDSDECLGVRFGAVVRNILSSTDFDGYSLARYWLVGTDPLRHVCSAPHYPDWQDRLWRHAPDVRYSAQRELAIHTQLIAPSRRWAFLQGVNIFHFDLLLQSKEQRLAKIARYDEVSRHAGAILLAGDQTR
ncbi:MAG: glycosyltransferase family 2 protein [Betaproteobacteria bacterium]|nr:glycosyltransferase family 2 protein [Betaproteobacteria bacterium]